MNRLFVLFIALTSFVFIPPAFSEPGFSVSFSPGSGNSEFGIFRSPEGPETGPIAVLSSGNGLIVLDQLNHRLVRLDEKGLLKGTIPLPQGLFKDLSRSPKGLLWLIDEETRTALVASGGTIKPVFSLSQTPDAPQQIDGIVCVGERLVIADHASQKIFFFTPEGKTDRVASWSASLSIVSGPHDDVCFLGQSEDIYDRLIRIASSGTMLETRITGNALEGARLLGFLPDGRAVGLGIQSREPFIRQLFLIEKDGKTSPIAAVKTPLLFATRYGCVSGNIIWLNESPIGQGKIIFSRYEVR